MSSPVLPDLRPSDRLHDYLAASLDSGTKLRVYHAFTPPVPTVSVFAARPGQPDEPTTCESHFLTVAQSHVITSANDNPVTTNEFEPGRAASHVLVLGIEVLIFSTEHTTTIFVSKADSTGFLSRPTATKQGSSSIIKAVISAFLQWLVTRQLSSTTSGPADVTDQVLAAQSKTHVSKETSSQDDPGQCGSPKRPRRLVLSLFARSQNQYLFPGSIENTTKHVLDDRQLIKWWCRLLDGLVQKEWHAKTTLDDAVTIAQIDGAADNAPRSGTANVKVSAHAYVVVPGCDRADTVRSFFPPSAKYPQAGTSATWHNSYPVSLLLQQDSHLARAPLPARCLIPRLPDDPKARYCYDLDAAGIDESGEWKTIRSLQQFWETMEYRQECAAGRLVGFVWLVFGSASPSTSGEVGVHTVTDAVQTTNRSETVAVSHSAEAVGIPNSVPLTTGSVTVTNEQYIELSDLLINDTDFAGSDLAIKSTNTWVDKVKELTGLQHFGIDIEGKKADGLIASGAATSHLNTTVNAGSKHPRDEGTAPVNVLTGVRKKKQKLVEEPIDGTVGDTQQNGECTDKLAPTNKPQKTTDHVDNAKTFNGVTTLSARLVRKKVKTGVT